MSHVAKEKVCEAVYDQARFKSNVCKQFGFKKNGKREKETEAPFLCIL